jgi:hypothetical protein
MSIQLNQFFNITHSVKCSVSVGFQYYLVIFSTLIYERVYLHVIQHEEIRVNMELIVLENRQIKILGYVHSYKSYVL